MNYDESIYKEKANRRARKIWLVFAILLSANYGSDTANGLRTGPYYLTFLLLCWVPFIIGQILLKVKGMSTDWYKYGIAVGYGIFYSFVLITSPSNIAFTYILPVTSLLVLYKNQKFMIQYGVANALIIIANAVVKYMNGFNTDADVKEFTLQLSCIILCYICYVMSIRHLNESDGSMLNYVKDDLHRVVTTVEQVKAHEEAEAVRLQAEKEAAAQKQKKEKAAQAEKEANKAAALAADDSVLLAALIQCEAGEEPYEGQVAVGAVVMNRVRSGAYPNTVKGVIYASGQFTPAGSGQVGRVVASGKIKASCLQAAQEAMAGSTPVGIATHFRRAGSREGIVIGHHVFW